MANNIGVASSISRPIWSLWSLCAVVVGIIVLLSSWFFFLSYLNHFLLVNATFFETCFLSNKILFSIIFTWTGDPKYSRTFYSRLCLYLFQKNRQNSMLGCFSWLIRVKNRFAHVPSLSTLLWWYTTKSDLNFVSVSNNSNVCFWRKKSLKFLLQVKDLNNNKKNNQILSNKVFPTYGWTIWMDIRHCSMFVRMSVIKIIFFLKLKTFLFVVWRMSKNLFPKIKAEIKTNQCQTLICLHISYVCLFVCLFRFELCFWTIFRLMLSSAHESYKLFWIYNRNVLNWFALMAVIVTKPNLWQLNIFSLKFLS